LTLTQDRSFSVVFSQQFLEHLDIETEMIPLLREVHRVLRDDGVLHVSVPDYDRIFAAFCPDRGRDLCRRRALRFPQEKRRENRPDAQILNDLIYQHGEHQNMFTHEILDWCFSSVGFGAMTVLAEADIVARHPEIPERNDEEVAIYVSVRKRA